MAKSLVEELISAVKPEEQKKNSTYSAEVSRIDNNGVVWVYVAGSDKETPTALRSSDVEKGDTVNVEWRNNKLYIAGNVSNPSAGTMRVRAVEQATRIANEAAQSAIADAGLAHEAAESAQADATRAQASADNAGEYAARALGNLASVQSVAETLAWITAHGTMTLTTDIALDPSHVYFVRDNNGDYTVGSYRYSVVSEPVLADIGTYYELGIDESLNNYVATHLAVDSEGLWIIPDSGGNKVLIATGQGTGYPSAGTYIVNGSAILASFTADGAQIGQNVSGMSRAVISEDGMQIYRNVSGTDTQIVNLGYGLGNAQSGTAEAPYYTLGTRKSGSVVGNYSVAEGRDTGASEYGSHAEGRFTTASGISSHAEGNHTTASGIDSHAEGRFTTASGNYSHAEGDETTASGVASHAQNSRTIAQRKSQTALGGYNIADTGGTDETTRGDYIVIVGNGTSNITRSNALTVAWDGNVEMALDTTATSGTDKEIYDALVSLGWDSDVIV